MSSLCLVKTLLPIQWSPGCSVVLKSPVLLWRFGHQTGIFLLLSSVCLGLFLSLLSWPLASTLSERHPFCLLLQQPKGLVRCTASRFECIILRVGGPAPSLSSLYRPWMILWTATGMISYFAPSQSFKEISLGQSNIIQLSRVSSCSLVWGRRGCLETPSPSGLDL